MMKENLSLFGGDKTETTIRNELGNRTLRHRNDSSFKAGWPYQPDRRISVP